MDGSLCLVRLTSPVWHIDAVRGPSTPSLRGALATKQSRLSPRRDSGLLRYARNDEQETACHHTAVPFMVGCPSALAVQSSMLPPESLALIENSVPSNSGCRPR